MIKVSKQFFYLFCLDDLIGVCENEFREEKIVPMVGELNSRKVMENIKFGAFTIYFDFNLRKQLTHYDNNGAYIVVDACNMDARVYVTCCEGYCIIGDVDFENSASPP